MSFNTNPLCIPFDAPNPHPLHIPQVHTQKRHEGKPWRGNLAVAAAALRSKRDRWASLKLRQEWADETFMRAHLKAAGIVVANNAEPATEDRLRLLLKRAGVKTHEARQAVGMSLQAYLVANPNLPLWAALALVLEATGRFLVNAAPKGHEGTPA